MKKTRHKCAHCGAKKYKEFMKTNPPARTGKHWQWICKNDDKCVQRCANYRK